MQTTLRLSPVPRFAWLVAVALLIVAVAAVLVLATGSRSRTLPAPFGPARNGTVVYGGADGDIHALDAATGATSVLVAGAGNDSSPRLSPDGTRFLFLRDVVVDAATGGTDATIIVANVDGTNVRALTDPLTNIQDTAWSHDGSRVVVAADRAGQPALSVFSVDGSTPPIAIDIHGMSALYLSFRPGDAELTFRGSGTIDGLYVVGADGRGLRTILATGNSDFGILSPDGSKLVYQISNGTTMASLHVVDAVTGREQAAAFDPPPDANGVIDDGPTWSPDGSQLLFRRYHGSPAYRLAVVPATGGRVVEIGPTRPVGVGPDSHQFSPDGAVVLAFYGSDRSAWILDPTGVAADRQLPSGMVDRGDWQRLGP